MKLEATPSRRAAHPRAGARLSAPRRGKALSRHLGPHAVRVSQGRAARGSTQPERASKLACWPRIAPLCAYAGPPPCHPPVGAPQAAVPAGAPQAAVLGSPLALPPCLRSEGVSRL
jgi:hypothetical protein